MYKNIQPYGGEEGFTKGRLRLVKSLFGCGYILTGTHPAITANENLVCNNAKTMVNHAILASARERENVAPVISCNRAEVSLDLSQKVEIDEEACHQIKNKTCVDDGAGGGTKEQEERFRGELINGFYNGTLSRILALVGLKLNVMIASGDTDEERLALMGEKLLGHIWRPTSDKFVFMVVVNFSTSRSRGQKTSKDLSVEDIPKLPTMLLTKRMLLGFVMSQHDPMGIICPLLTILKIKLCGLHGPDVDLGWDEPIPSDLHKEWEETITMFLSIDEIELDRAVRPEGVSDPPELIGFADGSPLAYACEIYIRWTKTSSREPTRYVVRMVCAKARVTSVRGTTAPRSEMEDFHAITPNDLLLQRSKNTVPGVVYAWTTPSPGGRKP